MNLVMKLKGWSHSVAGKRKEKKDPANDRCIGVMSMVDQMC